LEKNSQGILPKERKERGKEGALSGANKVPD